MVVPVGVQIFHVIDHQLFEGGQWGIADPYLMDFIWD
jgi:hypothetical protein